MTGAHQRDRDTIVHYGLDGPAQLTVAQLVDCDHDLHATTDGGAYVSPGDELGTALHTAAEALRALDRIVTDRMADDVVR